jgi:phage terminase small subunit
MGDLTIKQENFCQAYIVTGNASEAYRRAYNVAKMKPAGIADNASKLLASTNIALRIESLCAAQVERHLDTVEDIARMLHDDRAYARLRGSPAAAVSATMGLAKLRGFFCEKVHHPAPVEVDLLADVSDEEAANLLADRMIEAFTKRQAERAKDRLKSSNGSHSCQFS